jgi:hypothetical protein
VVTFLAIVVAVVAVTNPFASSAGSRGVALASTVTSTTTPARPYVPNPIAPVLRPALPGEGKWSVRDLWRKGNPLVLTSTYRSAPGAQAYISWIRPKSTRLGLYPGYKGPGPTTLDRGPEMVPYSGRPRLLATFNSGFYEADAKAGFYTHQTLYFPMINGLATLVQYRDGSYDVVNWTAGSHPGAAVAVARQNLHLLVYNSHPAPSVSDGSQWGITLHGAPAVWRTGVGIDRHGDLIYIAASDQTAASLAAIFVHVGCVRAMELDINPEWPIFVTYGGPGAASPSLDVPNPNQIPSRFLYNSTKDFFAVYVAQHGVTEAAW